VNNNLEAIVVYSGKLYAYSHYLAHITRSQFEMKALLRKEVFVN